MSTKPILISGAGLCSLLLAQSLRRASIPFLVFERDSSISFRAQGYRLRLSSQGLDAIETVLGPDDFQTFWEACGKTGGSGLTSLDAITGADFTQGDKPRPADRESKGQPMDLASRGGQIVGISRGEMRKLFMSGCEPFIQWGHRVTGYESSPSGVRAVFADGSKSVEGQMLIGGDGISSKIAKQLSGGKLKVYDTGVRGIHGQARTPAFRGLGEGVWRLTDDSNPAGKVFLITNVRSRDADDPNLELGWTMSAQPGVIRPPNDDYTIVGKPVADIARSLTSNWHPRFRPLFEQIVESEAAFWKITCSTPTGVPEWTNDPRVTVIGDAVHSMTPAGGMGANTAVRDSALLGRLLADADGYTDGLTATYEKEMRVYGSEAVRASYGMGSSTFGLVIDEKSPEV